MLPSSVLMQFCSLRCEIGQNHWLELEKKIASSVLIIFYLHLSRSPSKTRFLSDSSVVNVFPSPAPSAVHVSLLSPFTLCLIWMCFDRLAPPCGRIARRRRWGLFSLDPFAQASVGSPLPPPSAADLHPSLSSSLFPSAASALLPLTRTAALTHSAGVSPAEEPRCHSDREQFSLLYAVSSSCCSSWICLNRLQTLIWMQSDLINTFV